MSGLEIPRWGMVTMNFHKNYKKERTKNECNRTCCRTSESDGRKRH